MSMRKDFDGQGLVNRVQGLIERYVHFGTFPTPYQSLVAALWVIHTWLSERFPMTPYLHVSADTKGAGKTICLETLALMVRNPELRATVRALEICRGIEDHDGLCTYGIDEAEKLQSSAAGDTRSLLTTGYRAGQYHAIPVGKQRVKFRVFCPKMFGSIGDLVDVLRDRSIVLRLERGKPAHDLFADRAVAEDLAEVIKAEILRGVAGPVLTTPDFLSGRDREIWTPLWSIALAFGLDKTTMSHLRSAMVDLTEAKKLPPRHFVNVEAEEAARETADSERALRDVCSVLNKADGTGLHSAVAVERLKAIETAGWRLFRGRTGGLDQDTLAGLLRRFGLVSDTVWMGSGRKNRKQGKGWYHKDLIAALERSKAGVEAPAVMTDPEAVKVEGEDL